jgi:hypothetical protein
LSTIEGIIRPVVGDSALTWFIRYIYLTRFTDPNHVIIIKTNVFPNQDRRNLGARKPKRLNRIDKIWKQENQRAKTG